MAPFVRWASGATATLTTVTGSSCALGINDTGQIIGTFRLSPTAESHVLLWNGTTSYTDAGRFGSGNRGGIAINGAGRWLALSTPAGDGRSAFTQQGDGPLEPLSAVRAGGRVFPEALNDGNVAVGFSDGPSGFAGTLWHFSLAGQEVVNLDARVGGHPNIKLSPHAINEEGQIAVEYEEGGVRGLGAVLSPVRLEVAAFSRPVAGQGHTLSVSNCEPGARVKVLVGARRAARPYVHAARGVRLDVEDSVQLGAEVVADTLGVANLTVAFSVAGPQVLQVVHRGNKSLAIGVDVAPPLRVVKGVRLPAQVTPLRPLRPLTPAKPIPGR